jgi:hypothetical protein
MHLQRFLREVNNLKLCCCEPRAYRVDDVCVTRDQFAEVFRSLSAAAGAPENTQSEAPSGSSASDHADTASTTPPSESSEADGAAGTADTHTNAATGSEPGSAEAESGQPTVAPQDDSVATSTAVAGTPEGSGTGAPAAGVAHPAEDATEDGGSTPTVTEQPTPEPTPEPVVAPAYTNPPLPSAEAI